MSYVRWASRTELVSASTDSSLRLWDLSAAVAAPGAASSAAGGSGACGCVRTYTGHVNERNFVGLSVHRDLIAAGSEANEVRGHVYSVCLRTLSAIARFLLCYLFSSAHLLQMSKTAGASSSRQMSQHTQL